MGGEIDDLVTDDDISHELLLKYTLILSMRATLNGTRFKRAARDITSEQRRRLLDSIRNMDSSAFDTIIYEIQSTCLEYMDREQLRRVASSYGIPYYCRLNNHELRERIQHEQDQIAILREHYDNVRESEAANGTVEGEGDSDISS